MASNPVHPDIVREFLDYDPETGLLRWRERAEKWFKTKPAWKSWNRRLAGELAFITVESIGGCYYRTGGIFNRKYLSHRVVWAITTGAWPKETIDHINGNGLDNRICNLREATRSQNQANRRRNKSKKSGLPKGVYVSGKNRFQAQVQMSGLPVRLGTFATAKEASEAYEKAAMELQGDFSIHCRPKG